MSHKKINHSEDYTTSSYSLNNSEEETNDEIPGVTDNGEPVDSSFNEIEVRVERLKNDVKNLKKIKKQQEKLGKLVEKKLNILKEIEREQEKEKKSKNRYDKRKR